MTKPRVSLLNDTSSVDHHGCDLVIDQIHRHCDRVGLDLWHTVKLGDDWRRHKEHLIQSDLVIVNGEGTFHDDRKTALALAEVAPFCRERAIPCFLINTVYQGNGPEMANLVRQFNLVFVRESPSQAELRSVGIDSEVAPDMTLSHPDLPHGERSGVLFTESANVEAAGRLAALLPRLKDAEIASLFKPVSAAQRARMLVAGKLGKRAPKLWQAERRRHLKAQKPPFDTAIREPLPDLLARVSAKRLIVTGRFHMACMALLARTPFIAVEGSTHKIEGLLIDAGIANRYCPPLPDDEDVLAWGHWQDGDLARIDAYLQTARSRITQMFSRLRAAASIKG
jgi:hypothetical protein